MERLSIFINNIVIFIVQPLITLLFALALAYFIWGMAKFILNAEDPEKRKEGQQAMIWGVIGIFIMTAVIGILAVITNTFGVPLPR